MATTTLVTGANKGIGFETARLLIDAGHTVWLGCRDKTRGERACEELGGKFVQLDITDDASVDAAVQTIASLDVLVNNAGIMAYPWTPAGEVTPDLIRRLYETNVVGLVRTTRAFLPLLTKSANPVVVNVGSSLGLVGRVTTDGLPESQVPAMAYGSSKAAMNMITVHYAKAFPKMRINCVDPGYTATDMNGNSGFQTAAGGSSHHRADGLYRARRPDGHLPRRAGPAALVTSKPRGVTGAGPTVTLYEVIEEIPGEVVSLRRQGWPAWRADTAAARTKAYTGHVTSHLQAYATRCKNRIENPDPGRQPNSI